MKFSYFSLLILSSIIITHQSCSMENLVATKNTEEETDIEFIERIKNLSTPNIPGSQSPNKKYCLSILNHLNDDNQPIAFARSRIKIFNTHSRSNTIEEFISSYPFNAIVRSAVTNYGGWAIIQESEGQDDYCTYHIRLKDDMTTLTYATSFFKADLLKRFSPDVKFGFNKQGNKLMLYYSEFPLFIFSHKQDPKNPEQKMLELLSPKL
ncbi:MAG TPA: hypothetical protein VEK38_00740 [Candidatus Bathyarchaeia archaeon]|nr:hypothetical protein [Candidatus Bathyarchaeia archaeon]